MFGRCPGLCPVANLGISGVEASGSRSIRLVEMYILGVSKADKTSLCDISWPTADRSYLWSLVLSHVLDLFNDAISTAVVTRRQIRHDEWRAVNYVDGSGRSLF